MSTANAPATNKRPTAAHNRILPMCTFRVSEGGALSPWGSCYTSYCGAPSASTPHLTNAASWQTFPASRDTSPAQGECGAFVWVRLELSRWSVCGGSNQPTHQRGPSSSVAVALHEQHSSLPDVAVGDLVGRSRSEGTGGRYSVGLDDAGVSAVSPGSDVD